LKIRAKRINISPAVEQQEDIGEKIPILSHLSSSVKYPDAAMAPEEAHLRQSFFESFISRN
jgi:hypothetical protein